MPAAFVSSQLLHLFVLSPHRSAPRVCECDRLACFGPRVSCLLSVCAAFVAFSVCLRLRASSIAALRSSVSLWQAAYHTYFRRAARIRLRLFYNHTCTTRTFWTCARPRIRVLLSPTCPSASRVTRPPRTLPATSTAGTCSRKRLYIRENRFQGGRKSALNGCNSHFHMYAKTPIRPLRGP